MMEDILSVCSELVLGEPAGINVDFLGKGNLWVDNTYKKEEIDLVRKILFEAITKTAPGQLSVAGYDSDLSGIFAPFSALSSGGSKVLTLLQSEEELRKYLGYLRQDIQSVQNVIQGREKSLLEFRRKTGRAVEGYRLIVLSVDMGILNQQIRAELATLMRNGPANGVSFLIYSTVYMDLQFMSREEAVDRVLSFSPNMTLLYAEDHQIFIEGEQNRKVNFRSLSAERMVQACEECMERTQKAALPTVKFQEMELHKKAEWSSSSAEGLTFTVGKWGVNDVNITIGDEVNQRHNVLITGAVGQGKSNLISVIIHSLCTRYSPSELRLYLLDFKEGVTFKAFSNLDKEDYLPHAEALGLESDPEFGLAVLDDLYREYLHRMNLLKKKSVKSIQELRKQYPLLQLPRIVVVIDEFQMMFGEDMQTGQKIVDLLEKSVRLFRAAGIHFILASQTLTGNLVLAQKREAIFGQVPIRIALKNSLAESYQTLSMGNSVAAFLRPREAVVNLDYGEVSQNKKCVIAFADEKVLKPMRRTWWEKKKTSYEAPYVFESEKRVNIEKVAEEMRSYRQSQALPVAFMGEQIAIHGKPVKIPLPQEPGRNIAIIGASESECNVGDGILQSIAVSLAAQHKEGNARFIFCDFEQEESYEKRYPEFTKMMELCGYYLETISGNEFEAALKELLEGESKEEVVYVFGRFMDKWRYEPDPFGQGPLKNFVEKGPFQGIHFVGWWVKASFYNSQIGMGGTDAFNSKVFLRVDEKTVQSLASPFIRWKAQTNRALLSDEVELEGPVKFIPFAPVTEEDIRRFRSQIF